MARTYCLRLGSYQECTDATSTLFCRSWCAVDSSSSSTTADVVPGIISYDDCMLPCWYIRVFFVLSPHEPADVVNQL